jgi:hypothetical protein
MCFRTSNFLNPYHTKETTYPITVQHLYYPSNPLVNTPARKCCKISRPKKHQHAYEQQRV